MNHDVDGKSTSHRKVQCGTPHYFYLEDGMNRFQEVGICVYAQTIAFTWNMVQAFSELEVVCECTNYYLYLENGANHYEFGKWTVHMPILCSPQH